MCPRPQEFPPMEKISGEIFFLSRGVLGGLGNTRRQGLARTSEWPLDASPMASQQGVPACQVACRGGIVSLLSPDYVLGMPMALVSRHTMHNPPPATHFICHCPVWPPSRDWKRIGRKPSGGGGHVFCPPWLAMVPQAAVLRRCQFYREPVSKIFPSHLFYVPWSQVLLCQRHGAIYPKGGGLAFPPRLAC